MEGVGEELGGGGYSNSFLSFGKLVTNSPLNQNESMKNIYRFLKNISSIHGLIRSVTLYTHMDFIEFMMADKSFRHFTGINTFFSGYSLTFTRTINIRRN